MIRYSLLFRQNRRNYFISAAGILSLLLIITLTIPSSTQERYTPPDDWVGKVVLAELFTGSEYLLTTTMY